MDDLGPTVIAPEVVVPRSPTNTVPTNYQPDGSPSVVGHRNLACSHRLRDGPIVFTLLRLKVPDLGFRV